jgi:hypothetical protein
MATGRFSQAWQPARSTNHCASFHSYCRRATIDAVIGGCSKRKP